jgi:uncharacterized protein
MKQIPNLILYVLASVAVLFLLSACLPAFNAQTATPGSKPAFDTAAQPGCDPSRNVQVTGSALINVTPDRALIQLGVQSNGVTPEAVQAANSAAIQQVFRALVAEGVESKDIATDNYVIAPVYENYDSLIIKGYRIDNTVAVTLRDVKETSALLVAALNAGANRVLQVDFYTSDLRKYRDQARLLAMQAAKEKAQALAETAGARTGCVLSIHENSWSYYNGWWYGRNQNLNTQNVIQNTAPSGTGGGAVEEPISLGQISVKAEVETTFGLQ